VSTVFHIELRHFPNVARAFNMTGEELEQKIVGPWTRDELVELDDRRWSPQRARLTIYEGRMLRPEELGIGRGWGNVTRTAQEVTERVLAQARRATAAGMSAPVDTAAFELSVQMLGGEIAALCAQRALRLDQLPAIIAERLPNRRASERLALLEQAVWELLHRGRVGIAHGGQLLTRDRWEPTLLAWETWTGTGDAAVYVEPAPQSTPRSS
jgi:hypothetical protein